MKNASLSLSQVKSPAYAIPTALPSFLYPLHKPTFLATVSAAGTIWACILVCFVEMDVCKKFPVVLAEHLPYVVDQPSHITHLLYMIAKRKHRSLRL